MPGYWSTLISAQGDGTAVTNTLTEGSLLPAVTKFFLPSGYLNRIGKTIRIIASGRISNVVTTPGTLIFKFKLGPTANIAVATSRAIALNTTAKTNVGWHLDIYNTVRAIGASTSANFMTNGEWCSESVVGSAAGSASSVTWQDAPAVGTGFDSSVANQFDFTATFSVTTATTSIQLHTLSLVDMDTTP